MFGIWWQKIQMFFLTIFLLQNFLDAHCLANLFLEALKTIVLLKFCVIQIFEFEKSIMKSLLLIIVQ